VTQRAATFETQAFENDHRPLIAQSFSSNATQVAPRVCEDGYVPGFRLVEESKVDEAVEAIGALLGLVVLCLILGGFIEGPTEEQERKRIERQYFKLPSSRQRANILERHLAERNAATSRKRHGEA